MNNRSKTTPTSASPHRRRKASSTPAVIFAFVLVICLAVTMGYIITKQVIYPYILKQNLSDTTQSPTSGGIVVDENEIPPAKPPADDSPITESNTSETDDSDNNQPVKTDDPVQSAGPAGSSSSSQSQNQSQTQTKPPAQTQTVVGYCLQYANLSTKTAADQFVSDLKEKGVSSSVWESGGRFKVVSATYATKEEARSHIPAVSTVVPDVFVTSVTK